MAYKNLLLERREAIATLTLNRPEVLNAIDDVTLAELRSSIQELEDDDDVRVVIVTGAGERAFSAGADLKWLGRLSPEERQGVYRLGQRTFDMVEAMGRPVIAAVSGFALGGGLELALACDFIIASDNASFGLPEMGLGAIPGWSGPRRLPLRVGVALAKEMLYTADPIDAEKALAVGLVNRVVPADRLMAEVEKIARRIAGMDPAVVRLAKDLLNKGFDILEAREGPPFPTPAEQPESPRRT